LAFLKSSPFAKISSQERARANFHLEMKVLVSSLWAELFAGRLAVALRCHVRLAASGLLIWAMIPYDIMEPIFTVESKEAAILLHFTDAKKLKLGWIDDYKDVHFQDGK
jgi:hypothetical protein